MRATTRPILAAFLVILTALAAAAPAAARPSAVLDWRPCALDATAQCATLRVPIDWSDPYSATAGIALARRVATDPAHRIGTLVVNPGGPGGSGVDFVLGADAFFTPALRSRFDIVGFDPRGVGLSNPVMCSSALVDAEPEPLITSLAGYTATIAYNRRLAADCATRTGALFPHVDTLSVARDMDAIRAALGENQINFYGASYGTLLGAQYAQLYPNRVRALVLDSVMDHSAGVASILTTLTAASQDAFDQFVTWCAGDRSCILHGRDVKAIWAGLLARAAAGKLTDPYDPAKRMTVFALMGVAFSSFYDPQWYTLAYYLKEASSPRSSASGAAPPATAFTRPRTAAPTRSRVGSLAGSQVSWIVPALRKPPAVPLRLVPGGGERGGLRAARPSLRVVRGGGLRAARPSLRVVRGGGLRAARPSLRVVRGGGLRAARTPLRVLRGGGEKGGLRVVRAPLRLVRGGERKAAAVVEHSFPAVFCDDWALPVDGYPDLAAKLAALRVQAPQMIASPLALTAVIGCLGWPGKVANPQGDLRPLAVPALVVGTRHDPATAYAWAQHVAAQLGPSARLFTYEGWGHVAYNRTGCVSAAVDAYLITRRTPPAGASCPGVVPPPFGVG